MEKNKAMEQLRIEHEVKIEKLKHKYSDIMVIISMILDKF